MVKKIRVGINGFGRIGRAFARIAIDHPTIEISLVNTRKSKNDLLAHLLQYDSIYRKFDHAISSDTKGLIIDGERHIPTSQKDLPEDIPWKTTNTDLVLDCTGAFTMREDLEKHLSDSVKFVLLSGPTHDKTIPHLVLGINDTVLTEKRQTIVSNASCTTNCVALLLKTIHTHLGIERCFISTTHAYTSTQALLDNDNGDFARSRAAALSIVPTDTGAATAVVRVIPELENRIEGMAMRVPIASGSFADAACIVQKNTSEEEINAIFKRQAGTLKNYLSYCDVALVSADYVGSSYSCIYDANYTKVIGGTFIKVCGWYDNEWGYANRLVDAVALYNDSL